MKKILLLFLFTSAFLIAMEDQQAMSEKEKKGQSEVISEESLCEDLGLPHELWAQILELVYLDANILDKANDIYEGREIIEQYMPKCYKAIALVCKTFKNLNISQHRWPQIKEEIKKFYIPHLNQRFLKAPKHGFFYNGEWMEDNVVYPISGKWVKNDAQNKAIARFISDKFILDDSLLDNLMPKYFRVGAYGHTKKMSSKLRMKIIKLLLFYGLNLNSLDCIGKNPLSAAIRSHNSRSNDLIPIIKLLLKHGANPNSCLALINAVLNHKPSNDVREIISILLECGANPNITDEDGDTALYLAVLKHDSSLCDYTEIIKLLLKYGANPYIKNWAHITALERANALDFKEFEQLVRVYACPEYASKDLHALHFS